MNPRWLLLAVLMMLAWSGFAPKDRFTWFLEVAPVLIALHCCWPRASAFPSRRWLMG